MIKMGMEDQHFSDPFFLDAEGAQLVDYGRRQVAHPPRDDKRVLITFEEVDPRFLPAEVPEAIANLSRLAASHPPRPRFTFRRRRYSRRF